MIALFLIVLFLRFLLWLCVAVIALYVALLFALAWLLITLVSFVFGIGKGVYHHAQASH